MSKFKFRLEKVSDYRKMQENKAACALAQAVEHYENTRRQLDESVKQLEENVDFKQVNGSCFSVESNIHIFLYRDSMLKKITQLEDGLKEAAREAEEKRQEVIEARRECKVLEKLREKQYRSFVYKEKAEEQKVQDELAKQVFLLKRNYERR